MDHDDSKTNSSTDHQIITLNWSIPTLDRGGHQLEDCYVHLERTTKELSCTASRKPVIKFIVFYIKYTVFILINAQGVY